ncbi:MAG: hypothetical protein ACTSRW_04900 [Candidatus Helarchaeota archaeon]
MKHVKCLFLISTLVFSTLILFISLLMSFTLVMIPNQDNNLNSIIFQPTPITSKDASVPNFTNWYFNNDPFDINNVSQGLNVSVGTPVIINVTIQDNQGIQNASLYYWTSITENAGPDRISMINYTLVSANMTDNTTITALTLHGQDYVNNASSANASDDVYYGCSNDGTGILIPVSVNLKDVLPGDYATDDYVKITLEGHVNTTQGVSIAGIYLYNWSSNSLVEISNSSLNVTSDATSEVVIAGNNVTNFINNANNGRLEIFINVTGPSAVQVLLDYVNFEIHKDPTDHFYAIIPGLPWERVGDHKGGRENITFWVEAFDYDGDINSTQSWGYNYTNIDTEEPLYEISLETGDFVSGTVPIQITGLDSGSGIKNITLVIDEGTEYEENKTWVKADFESIDPSYKNITVVYNWDVSNFINYNGTPGTNATHVLNVSFFDRDGYENSFNCTGNITVYVDNTSPDIPYLNIRTSDLNDTTLNDLSEFTLTNQTETDLPLYGCCFTNTTSATYSNDNFYHGCSNGSQGILLPYAIELEDYNITKLENLNYLNLTITAKLNVSDSSITRAALQIYNWTANSLLDVDDSVFNSTSKVNATFQINRTTMWDLVNSTSNMRLELFINITSTVDVGVSVYYIQVVMERFQTHEIYCDNIINSNMTIAVKGYDDIYYDKLILYLNGEANLTWTQANSTNGTFSYYYLNSSDLPSGTLTFTLTAYDKAGNTNSTTMIIKNDNDGPYVSFSSHLNNSVINKNGTWNAIEKLIFYVKDAISTIDSVQLYIDNSLWPVIDGQQGQIIEYNATGDIVYVQNETTWRGKDFNDYIYFYWNISGLSTGSTHNLTIVSMDILGNANQTTIFVNISNYVTELSVQQDASQSLYYGDRPFVLSFIVTNTGNTTLLNIRVTPSGSSGYTLLFQNPNQYIIDSLAPGESITISIFVFPKNVLFTENAQIVLTITCDSAEELILGGSYSTTCSVTISVAPNPFNWGIWQAGMVLLIIVVGLGGAIGLHFLVRKIRKRTILVSIEDEKKPKKKK